jgi:hypothetical protein
MKMLTHVHKVVITCWCWHIYEDDEVCAVERVWVSLSLPPSLRARDSGVFGNLKCLFSTTSEVRKETEANGGHRGDRTLHRTRSWYDRTRLVSTSQQSGAWVLGFATGASGHSRDRHVRSGAQKELWFARMIVRGARPVTRDRTRPIVEGAYWTLTRCGHCRVRSLTGARPVVTSQARGVVQSARLVVDWSASGHSGPARPVVMRGASGHGV